MSSRWTVTAADQTQVMQVHEPYPGPEQLFQRQRVQAVLGEHHARSGAGPQPAQIADLVHRELGVDLGVRVVQYFSIRRGRVLPDMVADDVRPAEVQVQELADVAHFRPTMFRSSP